MLRTWLTERFDLDIPLISAPMGGAANGRFAAEVSRHGALGMVGAGTQATVEQIRQESAEPAGVGRAWGVGLLAWVVERKPELVEAVEALAPPLVSISYGQYRPLVERMHAVGSAVTTQAGTLGDALEAVDAGVDFLVVRGGEGGGHGRNEMATLPLLQEALNEVDIPVVAAGGIATPRGLAAVLAAGAVGAWVGTAFLGCVETAWPEEAKKRVVAAGDGETIYTRSFDVGLRYDWPKQFGGRAIGNNFSDRWHSREDELANDEEAAHQLAEAARTQDWDQTPVWSGQAVSMVKDLGTVAEVVSEFQRAEELLRQW